MLGLLDDVRVIELSHRLAGSFCAKLLADQGAETLKIEPPGRGDPSRYEPPFLGDKPNADNSSLFLAFNTNKRGVTLDVSSASGRALLERLLADQDILIESFQPGEMAAMGLSYEVLREINPRLIVVSITPFGQTGPYRDFQGTDLIAQAMGGFIFTTGQSDRPPMGTALEQTEIVAARNAVIAIMASLLRQRESGQGQHIDVSIMEAVVSTPPNFIHLYSFGGVVSGRGFFSDRAVLDGMHIPTQDSDVTLTTAGTGGNPMETWAEFLDEPRLRDEKFATGQGRSENWQELLEIMRDKLSEWHAHDFFVQAMDQRLVVGVVQGSKEVADCPHLEARGSFTTYDHPEVGALRYPGAGFLADGENPVVGHRAAPRLGEHNHEVYCRELGLLESELALLQAAGVV